ncbi:MAG: hypothetical protein U1E17_18370 [Geminicoccaceae bacterium]
MAIISRPDRRRLRDRWNELGRPFHLSRADPPAARRDGDARRQREPYHERVLAASPNLRLIARLGVEHDQVDLPAATRYGVAVAMAFGTNHETVADRTMACWRPWRTASSNMTAACDAAG